MADLIDSTRAKYNFGLNTGSNRTFTSAENTTLSALITAASKAIKKYCRREFDSQSFDQLYHGFGQDRLILRQTPIISIARLAGNPTTVLEIQNNSSSNQRATVAVTSTGVTLVRVASGTSTTSTIAFADQATLSLLATAITALGNGWTARVTSNTYDNRASADLRAVQGALNAKDVYCGLQLHIDELSDYEVDDQRGWIYYGRSGSLAAAFGDEPGGWYGGTHYWRVMYTAGYATVPEDVQEACAQWVAMLFWQTKRDPGSIMRKTADFTEQQQGAILRIPPNVEILLRNYRTNIIGNFAD